jgi:PAS domain S-box-containing protein
LKQLHKISNAFFDSICISIDDPFIVIDHDGEIISFNENAKSRLAIAANKNIFDLFAEQSLNRLNDLIEEVFSGSKPVTENIVLILKNGDELNVKVIINSYNEENELFIFCTFVPNLSKLDIGEVTKLRIKTEDLNKIISSETILKIIDDIKSLYPFTFLGKDKISRRVNELDELFWIKDLKGTFSLVNTKLASNMGLRPTQVEGKLVQSFLPAYMVEFHNTIENYIKETLNCMVLQGVPIAGVIDPKDYQVIEIPLSDSENNIIAIIGIAQKIIANEYIQPVEVAPLNLSFDVLKSFNLPLAFIDEEGIIKHGSKEFCKLFSDEFSDLRNFSYTKVFPQKLIERVDQFLSFVPASEKFELSLQVGLNKEITKNLIVSLNKIFGNESEPGGFSIALEDAPIEDSFERIINKRGRMFEILIQNNPEPIFIYDTENLGFIEANEAALHLYGYRKDEFLQMDLTDLYTPEDIQTLLDSSNMAAKGGKFSGPYKHKKKDGSYIYVEISKIGFKFNEKDAHFNIVRDVTAKLDLEKKNQLYRTAFDNSDDLLFITDNVGIITFSNPAIKKILGYSKNEIENTSLTALVKNDDRGTINSSIFHSHIIDTVTVSTELKNSEGKFLEVDLTAIPVLNYKNEVDSFSIIGKVLNNISAGTEVKEVIKEVFVEKPAAPGIKDINPVDPEFLPGLFHELLTPINVILGFVQEFTTDIKNLTPEQKEGMDIINQNRNRLLSIMNSVIEYSSASKESSEFITEEIGITEIIDQLQNDFNDISGGRNVEFAYGKISSSLKFISDRQKLQNFVTALLKISVLINKEKKIYFSAYQVDDKYFAVSLKDNYSHISEYMLGNYRTLFEGEKIGLTKDLGISKMTTRLAISLMQSLNGKFEVVQHGNDKPDCRFVFPMEYSGAVVSKPPVKEVVESLQTPIVDKSVIEPAEEFTKVEPVIAKPLADETQIADILSVKDHVETREDKEEILPTIVRTPGKTSERFSISQFSCLYIEDQVDSQILFKVQMKELKEIKFAVSFEDALPLLNSYHFDFLVIDINLQGEYNGLDALRIIHKMPGLENIPIIAVTAYVLPGDREKFIASGFNDFISKPIFHEKMIDVLEKIFTSII